MSTLARRHIPDQPVKKQSKWSPEEDALIIELRGSGMKWEDVSKRLPGRSAISCRLHYQNYLEKRSEWDEERKNKLARLYERFKAEMWARIGEEMHCPWRAVEAMHWQLGEADMARRAGVVPFTLAAVSVEASNRQLPPRGHAQSHSQDALRDMRPTSPRSSYGRGQPLTMTPGRGQRRHENAPHAPGLVSTPTLASASAAQPPAPPPPPLQTAVTLQHPHAHAHAQSPTGHAPPTLPPSHSAQASMSHHAEFRHSPGPGLAPIQNQPQGRLLGGPLPSLAQLTTGMSPFESSAGPTTPTHLPPRYAPLESTGSKRRASPELPPRDPSHHKRRL